MNITQLEDFSNTKPEVRYLTEEIIKYLNANQGGGGGLIPESYQNSAMSTPVYAYVYRDSNDNIVRVYEPLRNNDVSRSQVAYADSIDLFPFDSTTIYNNRLSDVKFVNVGADIEINNCLLRDIVIKTNKTTSYILSNTSGGNSFVIDSSHGDVSANFTNGMAFSVVGGAPNDGNYTVVSSSFDSTNTIVVVGSISQDGVTTGRINVVTGGVTSGNKLLVVTWTGKHGIGTTHSAEIYFTGDNAYIESVLVKGVSCFIDSIGENSYVYGMTILNDNNKIKFNNAANANCSAGIFWEDASEINFYFDGTVLYDVQLGGAAKLFLGPGNDQFGFVIGDFVQVGTSGLRYASISNLILKLGTKIHPAADNVDTLNYCQWGMHMGTLETSGNISDARFDNIDGTNYRLGVSAGNITATAI